MTGLYSALKDSRIQLDRYNRDMISNKSRQLIGDQNNTLSRNASRRNRLIEFTRFTINSDDLKVQYRIELPSPKNRPQAGSIVFTCESGEELNERISIQRVRLMLDRIADSLLGGIKAQLQKQPALEVLDVDGFTRMLPDLQDTLFQRQGGGGGGLPTLYVGYYDGLDQNTSPETAELITNKQEKIRERLAEMAAANPMSKQLVTINNPSKIIVFSAREVLLCEHFAGWSTGEQNYADYLVGNTHRGVESNPNFVRFAHILSPEQTAIDIELAHVRNSAGHRTPLRLLDPATVDLLEREDILLSFISLWLLDRVQYVRLPDTVVRARWTISIPQTDSYLINEEQGQPPLLFPDLIRDFLLFVVDVEARTNSSVAQTVHVFMRREIIDSEDTDLRKVLQKRIDTEMEQISNYRQWEQDMRYGSDRFNQTIHERLANRRTERDNLYPLITDRLFAEITGYGIDTDMNQNEARVHIDLLEVYLPYALNKLRQEARP